MRLHTVGTQIIRTGAIPLSSLPVSDTLNRPELWEKKSQETEKK